MSFPGVKNSQGVHLLVDFFGVSKKKLQNRKQLMKILCLALKNGGFRIIKKTGSHKFPDGGKGVTGFVLLAQSHAAFHSYPECGYLALDIYTCGKFNPKSIAEEMRRHLNPKKVSRISQRRG